MSTTLKISEAASIALHSMAYISANNGRLVTSREIVAALKVSDTHLSKILQRLVKLGFIESIRGPYGGFKLSASPDQISLLDIYESIEGKPKLNNCLLGTPTCPGKKCIFGNLIMNVNKDVMDYLSKTTLLLLSNVYEKGTNEKKNYQNRRGKM